MMLWRDMVFTNSAVPSIYVMDRAKDNFGTDLDAYVMCLYAASASSFAQVIYKPGTGGTRYPVGTTPWVRWPIPSFGYTGATTTSLATNNNTPVLPIFPVGLGYLATPCLGAIVIKVSDSVEGALIPIFMYGAAHTYLIGKGNYTTVDPGNTAGACVGIRWDT